MAGDEVVALHPDLESRVRIRECLQSLAHHVAAPGVDVPPEGRGGDPPERAAGVGADGGHEVRQEAHTLGDHGAGESAEVFEHHLPFVAVEAEELLGARWSRRREEARGRQIHEAVETGVAPRVGPAAVVFEAGVAGVEGEAVAGREAPGQGGLAGAGRAADPGDVGEGIHGAHGNAYTTVRKSVCQYSPQ
jgi:hypothetical protein